MKQSGFEVPKWMDELPKLTKRDKRRIKQRTIQRREIDADLKLEKRKKAHKRYARAIWKKVDDRDVIQGSKQKLEARAA
jgi:hypothetical protein